MVAIDITPAKDGGVMKEIIKEGFGDDTPGLGCTVTLHYIGSFADGTKFDSTRDRNEPFQFNLKKGSVIKACEIGVATMKRGEIALLTCSPEYAHGKKGCPPKIPPDATLKFEVEMIDWIQEDLSPNQDRGIERFQIVKGKKYSSPKEGALVNIHLVGMYDGREFENRDVQFSLGEGEDVGVIEGVERALVHFKSGEKSRLRIKGKYAFKDKGKPECDIPPGATVEYIVELKSFEKALQSWSLDVPENLEQAKIFKEKGTAYFNANKYHLAIKMYKKSHNFIQYGITGDLEKERDYLILCSNLNLAICYLKTDQNVEAKNACNEALKLDPQNPKAFYRRGEAYLRLASPDEALKDFNEVLKLQPKNTAAAKQVVICKNLIKSQLKKEKALYSHMFDKFAQKDRQKEEEELRQQPDVMRGTLGEWGQEERPGGRDATAFEKENPNILMLNANGTGEFQNM